MIARVVVCPSCGEENPDRFRMCGMCGAPLSTGQTPERRERRVVSVVFADLAGFTSRSERLDVEDVDAFLAPYRERLRQEVERHGGVVSDFAGDGMMAVFGAPVAHEDDPERAVRAALAIRDSFTAPDSAARASDLHIRLAVTTGEVLVTLDPDGGVRATGDVVNTAARLQAAARTDTVLVDEFTHRATDRAVIFEPADAVDAKGKAEPVPAWFACEPRSLVPEQERTDDLPLMGRERERTLLVETLQRAHDQPSAQLVSIVGEPGIGKTRLVEELRAHIAGLDALITWRRGRCLAYGEGVAFWALGEIVKSQTGVLESDAADVVEAKITAAVDLLVSDERDREWVTRHLRPLVGLEHAEAGGADSDRAEVFAAWRRFAEALAESRPTVLVFDDVHWADDALLDFIDLLSDRAGTLPLLIVCTSRPELLQRRSAWGGGKTNSITISLTPLSSEDTARLVGALLHQALLPPAVQSLLLERAEGNPFYAQEYVRMLRERGFLQSGHGEWSLTADPGDLPESLQGIIAARLDTLSGDEKAFIQDAAVVGRTAWTGAVCALTERSPWQADELLHALERRQLLQRLRRSSFAGETEFSFGHALTRDVAYSQIRRTDRAQKHAATAAWIEALVGERDDKAELLADHYQQALTLQAGLGQDTGALAPRAREAFAEAGRQAAAVHAHPAAARHYRAALALTPEDAPERPVLLLACASALHTADVADQETLEVAAAAQVSAGRWEAAAEAERLLAHWYEFTAGRAEDSESHLNLAATYAARVPPSEVMCSIASSQASRLNSSARAAEALALTTRTIRLAEAAGLEIGRAQLLMPQGAARDTLGDLGGLDDMRTAATILARHAHQTTAVAYGNLADRIRGWGDMASADAAYAEAAPWADRMGSAHIIDWIAGERAYQAYHAGEWGAADRLLASVNAANQMADAIRRVTHGRIALGRGRLAEAIDHADALSRFAGINENDEALYYGLALEALAHSAAGDAGQAGRACDSFLARWHETGGYTSRAIELCEIAPILATAGRSAHIDRAAELLPSTSRWREGLVLIASGRYAEAAALYEQIGSGQLAAEIHLLAAGRAADEGRTGDVRRHTDAVVTYAERSGASDMLARAHASSSMEG